LSFLAIQKVIVAIEDNVKIKIALVVIQQPNVCTNGLFAASTDRGQIGSPALISVHCLFKSRPVGCRQFIVFQDGQKLLAVRGW